MANWYDMLEEERRCAGDASPIIGVAPYGIDLHKEFYAGYGVFGGEPFTAWSHERVYFPVGYDGSEWVGSAPRNPCDEVMHHQGGG